MDSEKGDLRSLPFDGGAMHQPYMTMSIIRIIQDSYKEVLKKQHDRMMKGMVSSSSARRPHPRRRR